ncbi:MAG TPA: serine hydrolase domain-containing protein [Candidatus Baltobacteraceae bacterium]|nr:serine hydrolase domain-containing protein [Candidatus Baltobacteraceae bacterium]
MTLRFVSLALVLAFFPAPGFAQKPGAVSSPAALRAALQRDLDAYLKERGAKEHLSALSLSLSLNPSQPPINVTAGTTTYGGKVAATPADLFQIGSNTKAFMAVTVLTLEAQGRLSIDAPIGTYLPQYPAYAKLTLRRLLNMTGGLESYDNTPAWERLMAQHPKQQFSADTMIRLVYPSIKYPPGTKYYYSNTGYLLAQEVVAARSPGKSFEAEIGRVIAAAGLHDTYYSSYLYAAPIARRVVAGYYENDERFMQKYRGDDVTGFSLSWAQGAGSMVSTPADLTKWARVLYQNGALLPPKQRRELFSLISLKTAKPLAQVTANDPAGFGLGVVQRYDPKFGAYWFYQGETLGFRAAHLYFPKSNMVISIFANSRPVESQSHLHELFNTLYATIKS